MMLQLIWIALQVVLLFLVLRCSSDTMDMSLKSSFSALQGGITDGWDSPDYHQSVWNEMSTLQGTSDMTMENFCALSGATMPSGLDISTKKKWFPILMQGNDWWDQEDDLLLTLYDKDKTLAQVRDVFIKHPYSKVMQFYVKDESSFLFVFSHNMDVSRKVVIKSLHEMSLGDAKANSEFRDLQHEIPSLALVMLFELGFQCKGLYGAVSQDVPLTQRQAAELRFMLYIFSEVPNIEWIAMYMKRPTENDLTQKIQTFSLYDAVRSLFKEKTSKSDMIRNIREYLELGKSKNSKQKTIDNCGLTRTKIKKEPVRVHDDSSGIDRLRGIIRFNVIQSSNNYIDQCYIRVYTHSHGKIQDKDFMPGNIMANGKMNNENTYYFDKCDGCFVPRILLDGWVAGDAMNFALIQGFINANKFQRSRRMTFLTHQNFDRYRKLHRIFGTGLK